MSTHYWEALALKAPLYMLRGALEAGLAKRDSMKPAPSRVAEFLAA